MHKVNGQTIYFPIHSDEAYTLDRLETLSGRLSQSLFLSVNPVSCSDACRFYMHFVDSAEKFRFLSKNDKNDISMITSSKSGFIDSIDRALKSKRAVLRRFYTRKSDFVRIKKPDYFLTVNPIISLESGVENSNVIQGSKTLFWSARGAEVGGMILHRICFYASAADVQETDPSYIESWVKYHSALPGNDYFMIQNKSFDYIVAKGYFDFALIKNYIKVSGGYDKQFIGDGLNSCFISDFSASSPFVRINTRFGNVNYENLYMELTAQENNIGSMQTTMPQNGANYLPVHKYASIQYLKVNLSSKLNIGLFGSVIYNRSSGQEIRYLNPVIFLAQMEQSLNSHDKKNLGIDFKLLAFNHLQFYGQFLLDEFTAKNFFSNNGYWGNKWGLQLGFKYFDVANIKNLDWQTELNITRPYTYSHFDTFYSSNYTNYNQPLANPLGANFSQLISKVKFRLLKNLTCAFSFSYYFQGVDSSNSDFGSNIYLSYNNRPQDYNVRIGNGIKVNCTLFDVNLTYKIKPGLFADAGYTGRNYEYIGKMNSGPWLAENSNVSYLGLRLNIARRNLSFY